jgi:hypothetical protein
MQRQRQWCADDRQWYADDLGTMVSSGDIKDVLRILEKSDTDVEGRTPNMHRTGRNTPLMCAAGMGDIDKVKLLLRYKANVSATNDRGRTPLHFAVESVVNGAEIVMLLIEAGCSGISAIDSRGMTPLMAAAHTLVADPMVLDVLLRNGACVNAVDNNGWTALHHAVDNGSPSMYAGPPEVVAILLEHGADVLAVSNSGRTVGGIVDDNHAACSEMIHAAIERALNERIEAFAMGQHERLGHMSRVQLLDPELMRMIQRLV